jgi:hypothetical protein
MAFPEAWIVRCKGCSCLVTCFATDPQAEHLNSKPPAPPYAGAVHVTCACCWKVYRYLEAEIFRGQPRQSEQCSRRNTPTPKVDGALLVGASTVAAIRLRGEPVQPSPKLRGIIHDSVQLVRLVMSEIQK